MVHPNHSTLALDVGGARIGVAVASHATRIAQPLTTLANTPAVFDEIIRLIQEHQAVRVVVGLPRGLDGQHTSQTAVVEAFADELARHVALPLSWQDEAVTSRQAEEELKARKKPYKKEDIDALAATYILEDYLQGGPAV